MSDLDKYKTAEEIKATFKFSEMTLWRWMHRDKNPFPLPAIGSSRSKRLWKTADIEAWEQRERELILKTMDLAMKTI